MIRTLWHVPLAGLMSVLMGFLCIRFQCLGLLCHLWLLVMAFSRKQVIHKFEFRDGRIGHFRVTRVTSVSKRVYVRTIHMKMCSTFASIFMQIKVIFISMVSHVDSF